MRHECQHCPAGARFFHAPHAARERSRRLRRLRPLRGRHTTVTATTSAFGMLGAGRGAPRLPLRRALPLPTYVPLQEEGGRGGGGGGGAWGGGGGDDEQGEGESAEVHGAQRQHRC